MDLKPKPNRALYLQTLRRMTPAQRLAKTIELSDLAKRMLLHAVRKRFPDADEQRVREIYLKRLARCHNRSW